jgi:hypothetical protein
VKLRSEKRPQAREGEAVHLAFDAAEAHLFDPATGKRL